MTPGGDINRTAQRARRIQRGVHFDDHAVGDDALRNQLLGFCRSHFRNALAFSVQNAAHVGEQDQVRTQRCRQCSCRLVSVNVHQLALFGHADRAHHRQETAFQQRVNQLRRTRLRQSNVTERFVELGHFYAVAIAQIEANGGNVVFLRPGQQGFVRRTRQRTGDNVNLIRRRHAQAVLLDHRQVEPFHQLIHHAAAAVHNHQRTLV